MLPGIEPWRAAHVLVFIVKCDVRGGQPGLISRPHTSYRLLIHSQRLLNRKDGLPEDSINKKKSFRKYERRSSFIEKVIVYYVFHRGQVMSQQANQFTYLSLQLVCIIGDIEYLIENAKYNVHFKDNEHLRFCVK